MPRTPDNVPVFANEAEERAYWERHDSVGVVDWSKAERVRLPNLEPTIKIWLAEKVEAGDAK